MPEIKPRTTSVIIYQGDDLERLAELRRVAEVAKRQAEQAAQSTAPRRHGDDLPGAEEAEVAQREQDAYDAFVDEAAERAVNVEIHAIGRRAFRAMMAEHPPREGHEEDKFWSVNVDEFPYALLPQSIREPRFNTDTERDRFLDDLSEGDFERVFSAAYWLNRSPGGDPKDSKFSTGSQSSLAS